MKITLDGNRIEAESKSGVSVTARIELTKSRGRIVPVLVFDRYDKATSALRARVLRAMGALSIRRGGRITPLNDTARTSVLARLSTLPGLKRL